MWTRWLTLAAERIRVNGDSKPRIPRITCSAPLETALTGRTPLRRTHTLTINCSFPGETSTSRSHTTGHIKNNEHHLSRLPSLRLHSDFHKSTAALRLHVTHSVSHQTNSHRCHRGTGVLPLLDFTVYSIEILLMMSLSSSCIWHWDA